MNNNIGIEQNGHSSSASVHFDYFLVGRGADKSLLYNETSSNSYAMTYLPNLSLVRCTFKNKKILFNGSFSYEINDFFQHSIDNKHTLYTINDLKKIIKANGGSIEELTQFLGYAARLVVEAPLELDGTEGTKKDEQRQGENNGFEGEAENGKKKEQKSDDDDAIGGLESDDDSDKDSVLTTLFDSMDSQKKCNTKKTTASVEKGPFFKFVKTIVNNLIDWGTERHRGRHMTAETEQGSIKRPKFCAKLRLKIGNEWRWEDHFFNEFANNNTGEVLRIVRVPIATENDDAKFVLNDVFILRYARDEMDTLPTDLNALFAEEQFDCRVVIVEEAPAKITNFL